MKFLKKQPDNNTSSEKEKSFDKNNIILVGGAKVGKKTLAELIFGKKADTVNDEARNIVTYNHSDMPFKCTVAPGYQLNKTDEYIKNISELFQEKDKNKNGQESQIVWYCISVSTHRIQEIDIEILKKINAMGKDICIVFTKCDLDESDGSGVKELYRAISRELKCIIPYFQVSNHDDLKAALDLQKLLSYHGEKGKIEEEIPKYQANILVLGKTGSGKSSLINYLYGAKVRPVGVGLSQTEKGIFKETFTQNSLTVNIYDTWGLQAGGCIDWKELIAEKLQEHDNSPDIRDWFHSIFYCISMGNPVIDDFEFEILRELHEESSNILLVLTNCDTATAAKISNMKALIRQNPLLKDYNLNIVELSSVNRMTRSGSTSQKFGRSAALGFVFYLLWQKIAEKLPPLIIAEINELVTELIDEMERTIIENIEGDIRSKKLRLSNVLDCDFDLIIPDEDVFDNIMAKCTNKVEQRILEAAGIYKAYYGVALGGAELIAEEVIDEVIDVWDIDDDECLQNLIKQTKLKFMLPFIDGDMDEDDIFDIEEPTLKDILKIIAKMSGPVYGLAKMLLFWKSRIREVFRVAKKEAEIAVSKQERAIKEKLLEIGQEQIHIPEIR